MVEGMDSGSGAGMTRVTFLRQWNGPAQTPVLNPRPDDIIAAQLAWEAAIAYRRRTGTVLHLCVAGSARLRRTLSSRA